MEKFDSHAAFEVMDFARSQPDSLADRLFRALSRKHPFKMFRYALDDTGLLQDWDAFKSKAYADMTESMLEGLGIDVVDGKILCNDKKFVRIYEAQEDGPGE